MAALTTDPFADYYGVVLTHEHSGPLLWSPVHRDWLRKSRFAARWDTVPVDGDKVDEEELEAALALANDYPGVNAQHQCECMPRRQSHYIAVDMFGKPRIYCVQAPAFDVVGSSGEGGVRKHWGSTSGCTAVRTAIVSGPVAGTDRSRTFAACVFGVPLPADEVLMRDWCRTCSTRAARVASRSDNSEYYLQEHEGHVRALAGEIRRYL
jgi:hypothetical protein